MPLQLNKNYNSKIADALFNDSPLAIFILNNNGIVKSANKSAINLLNTTSKDIQFKSIFELFPKMKLIFPTAWWQKLYYTNSKEISTQFTNKNNEVVYVKITVQFNVELDVHLVFVTVISASDYKENSILKPEDKLAAFFDSSIDLIAIISPQK
jgi:PAS domain-containing protein